MKVYLYSYSATVSGHSETTCNGIPVIKLNPRFRVIGQAEGCSRATARRIAANQCASLGCAVVVDKLSKGVFSRFA
jgi:hypothetical protein